MTILKLKKKMRMNCLWELLFIGSLLLIMFDPFDYLPEFLGGNPEKPAQNKKVEGKPSYTPLIKQKEQVKTAEPLPAVVKGSVVNYNTKQESDPIKIAIPLITENEGFEEKAYYDKLGKVWTIGTGITRYADGKPVKQGDVITREQNDKELYNYLQKGHEALKKQPAYKDMNPNQIASTLDLTYNIGYNWTKEKNASLLDATSSKEKLVNLPDAMRKYNKAGGKVVKGLVNRRERGVNLFNTPYEQQQEQKK